jgi:hypothetical protein
VEIQASIRGTDSGTSRVALGRPGYSPLAPHQHHDQRRHGDEEDRNGDGATEAIMLAHGFTIEMLVDLVQEGLATATPETVQQ